MPGNQATTAADWLIAEFDAADTGLLAVYDDFADEWVWPHHVQPMFTLKTDTEPGTAMSVRAVDYKDPMRWWL